MPRVAELTKHIEHLLEQIERSTNQEPQPDARHASFRYAWPAHATVELVDADNSSEPLSVTLEHISRDGLDFRSSRSFQPDQKVLISLETDEGELQIAATVVHSTESVEKFVVGVKFDLQDSCEGDDK